MLLMVDVIRPGQPTEAEPLTVDVTQKSIWLTLDDGTVLAFSAQELRLAVEAPSEEARAA